MCDQFNCCIYQQTWVLHHWTGESKISTQIKQPPAIQTKTTNDSIQRMIPAGEE
jgi:hypothetical protein